MDIGTTQTRATATDAGAVAQHLELLRKGIVAAQANDKAEARTLFHQAIEVQDQHEAAWLWLASVAEGPAEVRACMERVLAINPDNENAMRWLGQAESSFASCNAVSVKEEEMDPKALETFPPDEAPEEENLPVKLEQHPEDLKRRPDDTAPLMFSEVEKARASIRREMQAQTEAARRTVLTVDDSPTVCKLVSMTLERQGYRVISAADGLQALAKLQDITPDLVLLDIAMPNLDGYSICKVIKTNAKTADVPVVMLSGKDGFFDKVRGRMAGAVDYITKPFDPKALLRTIDKHVKSNEEQAS